MIGIIPAIVFIVGGFGFAFHQELKAQKEQK